LFIDGDSLMDTGPIISATGVMKTYRSRDVVVEALNDVSFEVQPGEMVAVMGPSGSGKTTLLNCMSGLDSIDGGDVAIAGQLLRTMSDDELSDYRASSMGFVFQAYNLLPVLSAQENVELPLVLAGVSQREARERAAEKLELVGLGDRTDHLPAELSGGQQQRVAIARALANDPAIVWADEPTGNLDSTNASEIMDLLVRLNNERGQTFVLVTHSEDVGGMVHRIVRMRDGVVVSTSDAATARSNSSNS
jgi:putative ABC transport system ATP-binding protein